MSVSIPQPPPFILSLFGEIKSPAPFSPKKGPADENFPGCCSENSAFHLPNRREKSGILNAALRGLESFQDHSTSGLWCPEKGLIQPGSTFVTPSVGRNYAY